MRIALYGGMFDPVHRGHLYAAECAVQALALDRVIFIPARVPPHKAGCMVSGEHRAAMLRAATAGNDAFFVSDYELTRAGTSYSYLTAEHFAKTLHADKLYFLIGDEAYNLLHTWKFPERIRAVAEFAVITRDNTPPPEDAVYIRVPAFHASSTEVRESLEKGEKSPLLTAEVAAYIEEHTLYRKRNGDSV